MGLSQDLYKKAKTLIPGGTQLLSKRPELFLPEKWPAYYKSAKGCEIEDLDGNKYIDMITMGIGANILGYSDPDVNEAVKKVIDLGNMTSLNAPEEIELAELLIDIHPWANMVRYVRTGGEAMAVAVRIGRAKSKKDKVLFCGTADAKRHMALTLESEPALLYCLTGESQSQGYFWRWLSKKYLQHSQMERNHP